MSESYRPTLVKVAEAAETSDLADVAIIEWYGGLATELLVRLALSLAITEWTKAIEEAEAHLALLKTAVEMFGECETA